MGKRTGLHYRDKDYSHLEGRVFNYELRNGEVLIAVVALIDYNIGITVTELNKEEVRLMCLKNPNYPIDEYKKHYDSVFFNEVRGIATNNYKEITDRFHVYKQACTTTKPIGEEHCPFANPVK